MKSTNTAKPTAPSRDGHIALTMALEMFRYKIFNPSAARYNFTKEMK